jgi:hypothetical protein
MPPNRKRDHSQIQKGPRGWKGASTHQPIGTNRKSRTFSERGRPLDSGLAYRLNVCFGSLADKPSRAIFHCCPLWSKSGQTRAQLECPLCAISDQTHRNMIGTKERPPRGGQSLIGHTPNGQAAAWAFRFLRQPSRPNAPRPVAKSGRAAGNGVASAEPVAEIVAEIAAGL